MLYDWRTIDVLISDWSIKYRLMIDCSNIEGRMMAQLVAGSEVSDKNVIDWFVFVWSAGESNAVESQRFLDDHRGPRGIHKGKECRTHSIHIAAWYKHKNLKHYEFGSDQICINVLFFFQIFLKCLQFYSGL